MEEIKNVAFYINALHHFILKAKRIDNSIVVNNGGFSNQIAVAEFNFQSVK